MQEEYIKQLNQEVKCIYEKHWLFMNEEWCINEERYFHTTEIKSIKNINEIKKELLQKLGIIPIYYFLNVLYTAKGYIGPYNEIEKGLLLLYQLINGFPSKKIKNIPYSSYVKLYKQFWIKKEQNERLNKLVNASIKNMFTTQITRILSALINNPEYFKQVTLFLDGHDGKIAYYGTDIDNIELNSYKFDKPGLRTQVVFDVNGFVVFLSPSQKCAINNDGSMFAKMKIENFMNKTDCVALDGGYTLHINQVLEKNLSLAKDLNLSNFCYPIRKPKNGQLTEHEENFNTVFKGFRAKVEHQFSDIGMKFGRFNNCKSVPYITDINIYNLQFRVACLLRNIKIFCEKYNVNAYSYQELWLTDNFRFPTMDKKIDYMVSDASFMKEQIQKMRDIQYKFLGLNIEDEDIEFDEGNSDNNQLIEKDFIIDLI